MKELLEALYRELVDHPEAVRVTPINGGQSTIFELQVHPEDLGHVIGRQGRIAEAVRVVLGAAGKKHKKHFALEILDSRHTGERS